MDDAQLFYNKFEIPLTIHNTEEVFDNIKSSDNPAFIDSRLVKDVYLPVHIEDGTSARSFAYNYSKEDYYELIKKILSYKPVVVTNPYGYPEVLEKYINLGVKEFMVSNWRPEYSILKKKYNGLKIYRSIVYNPYNEEFDPHFDAIVIPYQKLLNLEWIKEKSKQISLIAIINHWCRANCNKPDIHAEVIMENDNETAKILQPKCPAGRSLFIPRQVVLKMNPYVDTFKIVDRLFYCFDYEKYIKYYIGQEMLNEGDMGSNLRTIKNFYEGTIIHKLYEHSNLVNGNCEFKCHECDKKCY